MLISVEGIFTGKEIEEKLQGLAMLMSDDSTYSISIEIKAKE